MQTNLIQRKEEFFFFFFLIFVTTDISIFFSGMSRTFIRTAISLIISNYNVEGKPHNKERYSYNILFLNLLLITMYCFQLAINYIFIPHNNFLAASYTASGVIPNPLQQSLAFPEAPKRSSIPIWIPSQPMYLSHPYLLNASTATLAFTLGGNTESLYSLLYLSNRVVHGRDTARAFFPSLPIFSAASQANGNSVPVPIRMTSGSPSPPNYATV